MKDSENNYIKTNKIPGYNELVESMETVAQESTSQSILTAVGNLDTSDLAKEATALQILQKVSVGADALETEVQAGKAAIVDAIEDKGGTATASMSLAQLAGAVADLSVPTPLRLGNASSSSLFENSAQNKVIDMTAVELWAVTNGISFQNFGSLEEVKNFPHTPNLISLGQLFTNCSSLVKVEFGNRIDTSNVTQMAGLFDRCGSLEKIDMSMLDSGSVTSIYACFSNCTHLKEIDIRNLHFAGYVYNMFLSSLELEEIDMRNTDASRITQAINITPSNCPYLTTLVGGISYEDVVEGNVKIWDGLNIAVNTGFSTCPNIDKASFRAIINGLADRTGQSALTLSGLGAGNLAKLSAEDIAVATNKNWNITA